MADLDGDGYLDWIAHSHFASLLISYGIGRPDFDSPETVPAPSRPNRVLSVDLNSDERDDVIVAYDSADFVSVLLASVDGGFEERVDYPTGDSPASIIVGDLGTDGITNVVVTNAEDDSITLFRVSPVGELIPHIEGKEFSAHTLLGIGDMNGDGEADLIARASDAYFDVWELVENDLQFAGQWRVPEAAVPLGRFDAVDLNGDQYVDFLGFSSSTSTSGFVAFVGTGGTEFVVASNVAFGVSGGSVVLCDMNVDGRMDVVVAMPSLGEIAIYLGNGDGTFSQPVNSPCESLVPRIVGGDFNGDGLPDVAGHRISGSRPGSASIYLGTGDGRLAPSRRFLEQRFPPVFDSGDFNGDGYDDLLMSESLPHSVIVWPSQCSTP